MKYSTKQVEETLRRIIDSEGMLLVSGKSPEELQRFLTEPEHLEALTALCNILEGRRELSEERSPLYFPTGETDGRESAEERPLLFCPACGAQALSPQSNFCHDCGTQLREIPPEDAVWVKPEAERRKPKPVIWVSIHEDEAESQN